MSDDIYNNLTILCVEDEAGVRRRIANALAYYFKEVLEAQNGQVGLDSYYENSPDIILCDVEMPIMNGIEMIKKIRADDMSTPIIILTAYSNEEYLMKLINLHVQHYILKPVNSEKLLEGIRCGFAGKYTGQIKLGEELFLDLDNNMLHVKEGSIDLSLRETKFLTLLAKNRGQIIYYATIEEELWGDRVMSQGALKSFLRDLRKKLPENMIENISQVGYRL